MPSAINELLPANGGALSSAPIRSNFAAAKTEIEALQAENATQGTSLSTLQSTTTSQATAISTLQSTVSGHTTAINTLATDLDALEATVAGLGGGASKTYTTDNTAGRALTSEDKGVVVVANSAAVTQFTVPNDTTMAITGSSAVEIELYQKGTGRCDFVAGAGVTVHKPLDYPNSSQYVVTKIVRIGANTWTHV